VGGIRVNYELPKPKKGRQHATLLILSLRAIARDRSATARVRLEACKLLVAIDPTVRFNGNAELSKLNPDNSLEHLLGKLNQNTPQ
jgi:hypothetical protein